MVNNRVDERDLSIELCQWSRDRAQLNFDLPEDQLFFVDPPLAYERDDRPEWTPLIVRDGAGRVVAFCVLDRGPDRLLYTDCVDSVLVRGLSVDPALQGRGVGSFFTRQLPEFVETTLMHWLARELVLGVNQQNKPALQMYLSCDFQMCLRQVTGARGPQYVLRRTLRL
ncbi:GNAT family N-acetyltransferase [Corynebacterium aquilae]|uniref:GNAT family N-acetyltransferase n=1 Tax=Corynebacterium aquilae TaxID=203263 RepID=UPI000952CAEB|nr:GNAT family N-acetyltransferase [Corynebacterium aquilae]